MEDIAEEGVGQECGKDDHWRDAIWAPKMEVRFNQVSGFDEQGMAIVVIKCTPTLRRLS